MTLRSAFLLVFVLYSCSPGQKKRTEKPGTNSPVIRNDSTLQTGWYYIITDPNTGYKRQLDRDTTYYFLNPTPIVAVGSIATMKIYENNFGDIGLAMQFDDEATDVWSEVTDKATGQHLALVINDKLVHVPRVNSQIINGMAALNRGNYSRKELEEFKKQIETEQK